MLACLICMQSGEDCVEKKDGCGNEAAVGLHCDSCDELQPRCTRIKPVDPKTKVGNGKYTYYLRFYAD